MEGLEGKKFDEGKAPMGLLPFDGLEVVARVLQFGAQKYDTHNWRKGMKWSRLLDASIRHIGAAACGEWEDKETGLPHLAHAACCLLFILSYYETKSGENDLYSKTEQVKQLNVFDIKATPPSTDKWWHQSFSLLC